ncbi:MAG TPA: DUF6132 family protein [Rhizomicrobium sp.]|jgi:hypothetical protein
MPHRIRIGTAAIFGAALGIIMAFAGRVENGGKFLASGGWWSGFVFGAMITGVVIAIALASVYNLIRRTDST